MFGHSTGLAESPPEEHLHVGVETAELVVSPADQRVVDRGVHPEQDLAAFAHV